jgi:PKHD-type hydroxylase
VLIAIPGLLSKLQLASITDALKEVTWESGAHSAGSLAARVKNNEQLGHEHPTAALVRQEILSSLDASALFFSAALPLRVTPPRVNRYGGSTNYYGNHVDNAIRFNAVGERVRADMSCTVFLSDPSDYEGGELTIEASFGIQSIKLSAGDAVLYPGSSIHQVLPVTAGYRIASFFWIQSLVRSDAQRQILFDLDTAIRERRDSNPDAPEVIRLTGVYHNLLRLWSET